MAMITSLKDLNSAVNRDEKTITIKEPALTEYRVLISDSPSALGNALKGMGVSAALVTGAAFVPALIAIPIVGPLIGLGVLGAGVFKGAKAITYDVAKDIKTTDQLNAAKKQIQSQYSGVDFNSLFSSINKFYKQGSVGKSYLELVHK